MKTPSKSPLLKLVAVLAVFAMVAAACGGTTPDTEATDAPDLASDFGVSYLYITHDLAVARYMCDRIAVMYLGKIVEVGETETLLANAQHPYTRALLAAVPVPDPSHQKVEPDIKGGISKAINPPDVCRFLDRCPIATSYCESNPHPPLEDTGDGAWVASHVVAGRA